MRRRENELQEALEKMRHVQIIGEENEHEMQQFYKAIFDTNNVVELSADAVITDVNQNLLDLFNANNKSVFVGKHASAIIGNEATNAAWANLTQGRYFEDVQTAGAGSEKRTIRQKFIPIRNKNGNLLRVLILVFPENRK
jgi:PAS domain-containing protein